MRLATLLLLLVPALATAAGPPPAFDHGRTGFELRGAHRAAPCAGCHQAGIFEGTPTRCDGCHDGVTATGLTPAHVRTTRRCDACHRPEGWTPVLRMDHLEVLGNCAGCHNNVVAPGKHAAHMASSNDCGGCHDTRDFGRAVFDHAGITAACSSCHNGSGATGKPAGHVATTSECNSCHSTLAWRPASFDHANVTGACSSCHNGTNATGKGAGHFSTTEDCATCHTSSAWTPIRFTHSSPNYPGTHQQALACTACHTSNAQTVPWPFPAYQPACAGCHAGDFRQDAHKKTEQPSTVFYTVGELRNCSGSCHLYTDNTFTTIRESRSGEHRVSDGSF